MALELTVIEKTELEKLETIINQDMGAFYRVGCALAKIRDSRLYRETHDTFEAYCKDRWEMSKMHAYRLMDSSKVQDALKSNPLGYLPINERQARPLTKLATAEAQQEAWEMVVETAPEGKITAKHIASVIKKIQNETIKEDSGEVGGETITDNIEEVKKESDKLFQLKLYWKVTTKKDRKIFLQWIKTVK